MRRATVAAALAVTVTAGCAGEEAGGARGGRAPRPATSTPAGSMDGRTVAAQPAEGARGAVPSVLFVGTSLTAGLGLEPEEAFPARVEELARAAGTPIRAVNRGLSGETSSGALRRIDWVLSRGGADVIVVETGANDGLRGIDPDSTQANLAAIVARVRAVQPDARVVLVQMEAPPNLGDEYTQAFRAMYPAVARQYGLPLVPFLLDGVAGVARLNQADGLHPTAEGARVMARTVWRGLKPVVESVVEGDRGLGTRD